MHHLIYGAEIQLEHVIKDIILSVIDFFDASTLCIYVVFVILDQGSESSICLMNLEYLDPSLIWCLEICTLLLER